MKVNSSTVIAKVVHVLSEYRIVINKGSSNGIHLGQRFLLYTLSEKEIIDPDSGESLGFLEIAKGTGKVVHVQERMCTIESDRVSTQRRYITRKKGVSWYFGQEETEAITPEVLPFDEPKVGDLARPI
jgi:proteasome assembly chaperone (PAC2) family protein